MHTDLEEMQVERKNPELILDVFKFISTPNRVTMRLLLCNGSINNNQLRIDLMEIFNQLYGTPIECRTFHSVLNSYVTCYLQSVTHRYHGIKSFTWPGHSHTINRCSKVILLDNNYFITHKKLVKNNSMLPKSKVSSMKSALETALDGLLPSNFQISHGKMLDNEHNTKAVSLPIEISAKHTATECDVSPKKNDSNDPLSVVTDFQTFSSPLREDYTKSSRGYSCQDNHNLLYNSNTQDMEDVDKDEFVLSNDDCYDPVQNFIISRYLDSLNSSSSESKLSYDEFYFDSDSDESVVFSEDAVQVISSNYCRTDMCKKIELDASFNFDSDCEDNVNFLGDFDIKCHEKSSKGMISSSDSETSDSVLFENCANGFSCLLLENTGLGFIRNNEEFSSSSLSLSQDVYSTDFGGFFNPCFEDDEVLSCQVNLININSKWENSMQDISCEPREPKRVSFPPLPDLESVQIFEPDEDNYKYSLYVLDQLRFKNRIEEFELIIKPYLSPHHRAKVYQMYNLSNNQPLS